MQLEMVGLGRMGANLVERLTRDGQSVFSAGTIVRALSLP
jgi:6-phosphogluconate dehydrogenase (decarboxylating)